MYSAAFEGGWQDYFGKLEKTLKERALKKIAKILEHPQKRHLRKGARYFVGEIGQYRIVYRVYEEMNEVRFYFIGGHKEYGKWCNEI